MRILLEKSTAIKARFLETGYVRIAFPHNIFGVRATPPLSGQ